MGLLSSIFGPNKRKLAEDVYWCWANRGCDVVFNCLKNCKLLNISRRDDLGYPETDEQYFSRLVPMVFPFVCAATIAEMDVINVVPGWTRVCGDRDSIFWQALVTRIEEGWKDVGFRQLIQDAAHFIRVNYLAMSPKGAYWPKPFDLYREISPEWLRECASEWLRMRLEDGDCGKRYIYNAQRGWHGADSPYAKSVAWFNGWVKDMLKMHGA